MKDRDELLRLVPKYKALISTFLVFIVAGMLIFRYALDWSWGMVVLIVGGSVLITAGLLSVLLYRVVDQALITQPAERATHTTLTLDFTPAAMQKVERMRVHVKAPSTSAVIMCALRLFEWWLEQRRQGYTLQRVSPDGGSVTQVEFMDLVADEPTAPAVPPATCIIAS